VSGRSGPAELRRVPPQHAKDHGSCNGCSIPRNAATEHCLRPGRSLPDAEASGTITQPRWPMVGPYAGRSKTRVALDFAQGYVNNIDVTCLARCRRTPLQ
jgi:hypothetical protein